MKNKSTKKHKIKIFKLYKQTFEEWLKNFNAYTKIVLVVAIPVAILTVLQADGNTGDFGLTMAFAWSFAIIALIIYSANRSELINDKLSSLYTAASGRFLQYVGVSIALILMAITGVVGWFGIVSILGGVGSNALLLIALSIAGIALSVLLLVRFSLAQVVTVAESKSIIKSLKASFGFTKGHFWIVFVGYLIILISIFFIANGIQLLLSIKQSINENIYINNLVYVIEATVFLPIIYIYQLKLLGALNGEG